MFAAHESLTSRQLSRCLLRKRRKGIHMCQKAHIKPLQRPYS